MDRVAAEQPHENARAEVDRRQHEARRVGIQIEKRRAGDQQRQRVRQQVLDVAVQQRRDEDAGQARGVARVNAEALEVESEPAPTTGRATIASATTNIDAVRPRPAAGSGRAIRRTLSVSGVRGRGRLHGAYSVVRTAGRSMAVRREIIPGEPMKVTLVGSRYFGGDGVRGAAQGRLRHRAGGGARGGRPAGARGAEGGRSRPRARQSEDRARRGDCRRHRPRSSPRTRTRA